MKEDYFFLFHLVILREVKDSYKLNFFVPLEYEVQRLSYIHQMTFLHHTNFDFGNEIDYYRNYRMFFYFPIHKLEEEREEETSMVDVAVLF